MIDAALHEWFFAAVDVVRSSKASIAPVISLASVIVVVALT
jgi:hypothetical protein